MKKVRVRFAPSPSGLMHLGNIRAAVINYIFATKQSGTMILRIEDTDQKKCEDEFKRRIVNDLEWLKIRYQEGPIKGGAFNPYIQSERHSTHQEVLDLLIKQNKVYRCFCSKARLHSLKEEQITAKMPPRYDRKCLGLSKPQLNAKLDANLPFVWRFRINQNARLEVDDLVKGRIKFDMKNFTDFAITRQDGSFNFIFTNFADDWKMAISHIIRGIDHLSNSALQVALFQALQLPIPSFFHLPIICDKDNKKLSKRLKSFCLSELKERGFLPQAITNYLATLGNNTGQEVSELDEIAQNFEAKNLSTQDNVKYDLEKLRWFNHQWIKKSTTQNLITRLRDLIQLPKEKNLMARLSIAIEKNKAEAKTLLELWDLSAFAITVSPSDSVMVSVTCSPEELTKVTDELIVIESIEEAIVTIKAIPKRLDIPAKNVFTAIRVATTGKKTGPEIKEIVEILGIKETVNRINSLRIHLEQKRLKAESDLSLL